MGRLGKHIRSLRQRRGITASWLAEVLGKTPGYLSRVERREEIPSAELLCCMSAILHEKPDVLLELAKSDLLRRTEEQIDRKASEALRLYRRSR